LVHDVEQVERVFNASHPDPLEMEKAKKTLKVRCLPNNISNLE